MWFIVAVVIVILLMMLTRNKWMSGKDELNVGSFATHLAKYFVAAIFVAFLLTFLQDSMVIVPAGNRGVIFDRLSGIKDNSLKEGLNLIIPFIQEATLFDVRVQKVEFTATAASKDMQTVHTKLALNFRPVPEAIPLIFRNYGQGYTDKVVAPAVQEAVKAVTARYTAEELVTKREEVKGFIHDQLARHMTLANLQLLETYITDFEFSVEFARAIEAKQIAEQQALKAKRDLDRIRIEAEQKIAQARAEAESLRMQKESITSQLVELRRIETQKFAIDKWDGRMPNIMMGDAMPLLDLNSMMGKKQ